jgi:hypothetical protein
MSAATVPKHDTPPRGRRPRRRLRRVLLTVLGGLGVTLAALWIGLGIEPAPLPDAGVEPTDPDTVALRTDLPPPVERFYRRVYGERIPVVHSAVISGRGEMRIAGITFPARYRFSHQTGRDYRHYIELTVFGQRVAAVNEWFLDGRARLELPFGVSEGRQVDQGANLALWAEAVWMPAVWLTAPDVAWEPIDATSARLTVPFGDETESLTVEFDPETGLLHRMTSLRFKGEDDETRVGWVNEVLEWGELDGGLQPLRTTVTWGDDGAPWADLRTEEVVHNADLRTYIRDSGA